MACHVINSDSDHMYSKFVQICYREKERRKKTIAVVKCYALTPKQNIKTFDIMLRDSWLLVYILALEYLF